MQINISKLIEGTIKNGVQKFWSLGTSHEHISNLFTISNNKIDLSISKKDSGKYIAFNILVEDIDKTQMIQYIRVLIFYGLINYDEIKDIKNINAFNDLLEEIENSDRKLSIRVKTKNEFSDDVQVVINNISRILNSKNDALKNDAKNALSTIYIYIKLKEFMNEKGIEPLITNLDLKLMKDFHKNYEFDLKQIKQKKEFPVEETLMTEMKLWFSSKGNALSDEQYIYVLESLSEE